MDGIIDTMIGFATDPDAMYANVRAVLKDEESREQFEMPAAYMFHEVPTVEHSTTEKAIAGTLGQMDRHGVSVGLVSLTGNKEVVEAALRAYPERFVPSWTVDPNQGVDGIRAMVRAHETWGVKAVSFFPHGTSPQVPIDAPMAYAYYARCAELGLPVFITVGIAGPRVPSRCQHVELLDQVLYDFPELVIVMRHGAEPWTDLAVKLMVKWPNLYYSTSAFAPRFYPKDIIDYANTRGRKKVMYGGYFPMGLELDRIFSEFSAVGLRTEVWPDFLRDNAARVLNLGAR